jgi:hypothetical protein
MKRVLWLIECLTYSLIHAVNRIEADNLNRLAHFEYQQTLHSDVAPPLCALSRKPAAHEPITLVIRSIIVTNCLARRLVRRRLHPMRLQKQLALAPTARESITQVEAKTNCVMIRN